MDIGIYIHGVGKFETILSDGWYRTQPITLTENKMYAFELMRNGLVTGVTKRINPYEGPMRTLEERIKSSNPDFNHMDVQSVGNNQFIVIANLNTNTGNRTYMVDNKRLAERRNRDKNINIDDLVRINPIMRSDTVPAPFRTIGTQLNQAPLWNSFSGSALTHTGWAASWPNGPVTIGMDMVERTEIRGYRIHNRHHIVSWGVQAPIDWIFQGTNNTGILHNEPGLDSWDTLHEVVDSPYRQFAQIHGYVLSRPALYRYYRLRISRSTIAANREAVIGELEFLGLPTP